MACGEHAIAGSVAKRIAKSRTLMLITKLLGLLCDQEGMKLQIRNRKYHVS